jgi:hypothetical protein
MGLPHSLQNLAFSKSSDWHFGHFMCDASSSYVTSCSATELPHRQGKSKASEKIQDLCGSQEIFRSLIGLGVVESPDCLASIFFEPYDLMP